MLHITFINLTSRSDRRKNIEKQCNEHELTDVFCYEAKDARTYKINQEEWSLFKQADFLTDDSNRKPIMCTILTHRSLWYDIVHQDIPYLVVLQDNIILCNDFRKKIQLVIEHLPENAEIVWIGSYSNMLFQEQVTPYVSRIEPNINPGVSSYIITNKGAGNLIEKMDNIRKPFDWYLNEYLVSNHIFYGSNETLVSYKNKSHF